MAGVAAGGDVVGADVGAPSRLRVDTRVGRPVPGPAAVVVGVMGARPGKGLAGRDLDLKALPVIAVIAALAERLGLAVGVVGPVLRRLGIAARMPSMGTFAAYVRVDPVGDRSETLISPQLQEKAIRSWSASEGHELVILPAELDASGGDDTRPILTGAIEQTERGQLDGIAVWKFDRFTRGLSSSLRFLERIESVGGFLRSASEPLDASSPKARMVRNFLLFRSLRGSVNKRPRASREPRLMLSRVACGLRPSSRSGSGRVATDVSFLTRTPRSSMSCSFVGRVVLRGVLSQTTPLRNSVGRCTGRR